ncbi:hypothetical protein D3C81_1909340 [compost metagenome]
MQQLRAMGSVQQPGNDLFLDQRSEGLNPVGLFEQVHQAPQRIQHSHIQRLYGHGTKRVISHTLR